MKTLAFILIIGAAALWPGCKSSGDPTPTSVQDPPPSGGGTSFQLNVKPIFSNNGCLSCHGGNGGLYLTSVASILQGGNHGPAVIPGSADSSNIIRKLSPTPPFGDRMPRGGPYLADSTVQIIRTWINEGAKNN